MDFILKKWEQQADDFGLDHGASWGDNWAIGLEVEALVSKLPGSGVVLDVGCANGYSTQQIHERLPRLSIFGVDFAPTMIANAQERERVSGTGITYEVGDVRDLQYKDESFDAVFTTRTLINLPSWEDQKRAIGELLRVTKSGGLVLISEAFWEPLCKLNALREVANLPPLEEHDFNRYLKVHRIEEHLNKLQLDYSWLNFSSIYYLGSRFLREITTEAAEFPGYSNPINKLFFEIESEYSGGPFSVQSLIEVHKN